MNLEQLERGNKLLKNISRCKKDIEYIESSLGLQRGYDKDEYTSIEIPITNYNINILVKRSTYINNIEILLMQKKMELEELEEEFKNI